ncbi:MAG: VacJ family lipoprotein [Gammaproteobacteria bacterium]|nr:VacJ family lipoprotein [Gammaproteobacteria bacterium]
MSFRHFRLLLACLCLAGVSACGTLSNRPEATTAPEAKVIANAGTSENDNARDPLEGFNRAMYTFNDKLDRYVLKPLAKGYRAIMPAPVSKSISNFFSNLHDPANMLNNLLQGKPGQAASDLGRVLVNSTIGIAGLFDVATRMGLEKHNEDFGQTLAKWGVGDGPYLVLPFFGSSNLRDGVALPVDWETYPPNHMEEHSTRDKLLLVEVVDRRAQLLDASDILEQAAGKDPYIFVREAFRQRRRSLIYDGNPPQAAPPPGLFEEDEPAPTAKDPSQSDTPAKGR